MKEAFEHIDDLIGKVLAGEASAEEQQFVDDWVRESAANQHYFDQIKSIFEKAAAVSVQLQFDEDAAWRKVKSKITPKQKQIFLSPTFLNFSSVLRIAAGVIIVLGISFFAFQWFYAPSELLAVNSDNQIINDTLPDGSFAVLNKKSELAYEYNKRSNTRKVKLSGEAYFEVKHEETKPFVIETDEVIIKDIGTAFNVKAYPGSDTVQVFVESGEVQFYTLKNPGLNLKAGEIGIYNKSIKEFSRIARLDTNALAYKTKIFSFNNTELQSAIEMLNEVYESKIVLANKAIGRCRLTVNFNNDNIENIADIIAETLNLTVTKKNGEWILDGTGCEK